MIDGDGDTDGDTNGGGDIDNLDLDDSEGQLGGLISMDESSISVALNVDTVRERVVRLVLRSLEEAEKLLDTGSPDTKMKVMRTIIPALMRALKTSEEDSALTELRRELFTLQSELVSLSRPSAQPPPMTANVIRPPIDVPHSTGQFKPMPIPKAHPPSPT